VAGADLTPLAVARVAQALVEQEAADKVGGLEDRYSHTDLWDLAANLDGARAASDLLLPAITEADPNLAESLGESFDAVDQILAPHRRGDGWASFETVAVPDRTRLKAQLGALADALSEVPAALGLR
jgi:iron uptake system component EfeO